MPALSSLNADFRRSLKGAEVEEFLDLWLYRRAGFVLARALQSSPITPNQVSAMSLAAGVSAGVLLSRGSADATRWAALLLVVGNIFDCADGQLARLRGTGSLVGYILDGVIDHLNGIAVFLGIGAGLVAAHGAALHWWPLTVLAGISATWWCTVVERKRLDWMRVVYGQRSDPDEELAAMQRQAQPWARAGTHRGERLLLTLYAGFRALSRWVAMPARSRTLETRAPELWARVNYPVLRMALLNGPTGQTTCIVVCAAFNRLDLYVLGTIALGNCWALAVALTQTLLSRKLAGTTSEAV